MTTAAQPTPAEHTEPRELPRYSCVRCYKPLTRYAAWCDHQPSGMLGYYCQPHAPVGAKPVMD